MTPILIKAAQFLLSISLLVLIHEFGHYLFARLVKVRVDKFYLFFDAWFSLFKFKKGETEYGIGWLPLGGYCKIAGMIDESMDKEQLSQPPQPWEYRSRPAWQRLLIIIGGVLFNFILALLIYSSTLFIWGEEYLPAKNASFGISVDSTAYAAGLRNGDIITAVNGKEIEDFFDIKSEILLNQATSLSVLRNQQVVEVKLPANFATGLIRNKNTSFISLRMPFVIKGFTENSPAKEAGLLPGDRIVAVGNDSLGFMTEIRKQLANMKGQATTLGVIRNGVDTSFSITIPENGKIGVELDSDMSNYFKLEKKEYSLLASIPAGITKGVRVTGDYLKNLKLLFSKEARGYESLGGFITIGSIFPDVWDWQAFWGMTAFLSIILAVMNLLPIPALDGGHMIFILYEMITRRKPSDKFLEYAQIVGLVLVFALMIYANMNDIIKYIIK